MNANAGNSGRFEVPCTVEIEHTPESLHAFVELDGVDIGPGDRVIVHGAPTQIPYGERIVTRCSATVIRASLLDRVWARIEGYLELTELYEVGFSGGRAS
ncbi:MAG: hypothetical protein HXY30_08175 [Pseudorhodoplanes sp.]|nr:hypothetical protein [Pseudorhodoplanes sp.]